MPPPSPTAAATAEPAAPAPPGYSTAAAAEVSAVVRNAVDKLKNELDRLFPGCRTATFSVLCALLKEYRCYDLVGFHVSDVKFVLDLRWIG